MPNSAGSGDTFSPTVSFLIPLLHCSASSLWCHALVVFFFHKSHRLKSTVGSTVFTHTFTLGGGGGWREGEEEKSVVEVVVARPEIYPFEHHSQSLKSRSRRETILHTTMLVAVLCAL